MELSFLQSYWYNIFGIKILGPMLVLMVAVYIKMICGVLGHKRELNYSRIMIYCFLFCLFNFVFIGVIQINIMFSLRTLGLGPNEFDILMVVKGCITHLAVCFLALVVFMGLLWIRCKRQTADVQR